MSIQVMSAVWKDSKQKGSSLLLLLAFADHAGDDGFCWPGYEHLAKKIRMSTRSVSRLVEQLEKDKELHVIRKQGEHNWYVVRVGMTNEDVIAVLKGRRMDTPDNLSALVGQETQRPMTTLRHVRTQLRRNRRQSSVILIFMIRHLLIVKKNRRCRTLPLASL
jgi:hypothetical protein